MSEILQGFSITSSRGTIMELHEKRPYEGEDDWQVLIKKAETFELMELQKILVNQEQLCILEKLLNDAYTIRRPKPSDYENRKQVIRVLNDIAKDLYGNAASCPVVEEFGSFLMDLFSTESDLDLSINFRDSPLVFPRDQKIKTLRKFAKKLYSLQGAGRVQAVETVMRAKVPILKFVDTATAVECDISVGNRDGISKSLIIRSITTIDERFQKLSFLMKAWAKSHNINSPKDRTLNSLSIILLVAFHLQTRDPPILPPFSAILKDEEDSASVEKSVRNFQNYGIRNTETLGELFVSFLIKLASVEELWSKGLCASPYLGHWTSKSWNNKIAIMSVEDFVDQTENVARAVGKLEVKKIYDCIHLTIENFGLFMNVKIEELKLKESFFGIDGLHHPHVEPKLNIRKEKHKKNHIKTKNPKLSINKVSNPGEPKSNASNKKHENNHLITQNSKLTLNKVSNLVDPKLNERKEKQENNHLMTQNSNLTLNKVSNHDEPKLNARKEKQENNHLMTQNSKLTINKISNLVHPKLNTRKEKQENNHLMTQNSKLTLNKVSNHDEPKLNARKEKHDNNHLMTQKPKQTMNKASNPYKVKDLRASLNLSTIPLPTGHWGVPQHQAMTAGPEISWAYQSYYHQPMMGMRAAEGMTATQRWEPAWGQTGWIQGWGGSSTGSWVGANGAACMDNHLRWSQEMQPAVDPWGRRLQQHPYGNSSNVYGPPYR